MRASKSIIAIAGVLLVTLLVFVMPVVASGASSALRSETVWMASAPVLADPDSNAEHQIPLGKGPGTDRVQEARNISLDFHAADITDVLKALSLQSGSNIVTGTDVKGQVTVTLNHVGLTEALDMITKLSGYKYAMVGPNTFAVGTAEGLASVLGTPNTSDSNTSIEVIALQYANGDDLVKAIPVLIPGVRASYGNSIPDADEKKDPVWKITPPGLDPTERAKLASKLARVLILVGEPQAVAQAKDIALKAEEAAKTCGGQIITEIYYPKYSDATELGQVASSIAPGVSVSLGPTTNFQLKQGDQVKSTATTRGGDAGGSYDFKAQPCTLVLTGHVADVKRVVAALKEVDIKPAQILIEARVVDIDNDKNDDIGIDWSWSNIDLFENNNANGNGNGMFIRAPMGFAGELTALVKNGKARVLASPKVAAVEGKAANIFIGDEFKYIISIQTTPTGQNITTDTALVGIQLKAMGLVGSNDDITLNLHPEVSTITSYLELGNGIALPQVARRFTDSTIRVRNGQTVIIGGLIKEEDINKMAKVPLLGDLPFFGQLFRHREHSKNTSEVVIFITATILKDDAPLDPIIAASN